MKGYGDMKVNRDKVRLLMQTYCAGNYNRFGRELGVSPSQVHRYLNTGVGGGKKLVGAIIKFCKSKGLEFDTYIDME